MGSAAPVSAIKPTDKAVALEQLKPLKQLKPTYEEFSVPATASLDTVSPVWQSQIGLKYILSSL